MAKGKLSKEEILKHQDHFFLITSPETAELLEKLQIDYLLLPRDSLKKQLNFLIHRLGLKKELSLEICTLCGEKLVPVEKEAFKTRIPPKVWERYQEFNYCPRCDKLYWEGDHIKRLRKRFKNLLRPISQKKK